MDIVNEIGYAELYRLMFQHPELKEDARYFHWDELRFRPVPVPGVSHEAWWTILRLNRQLNERVTPLFTKYQVPFTYARTPQIERGQHRADREAAGRIGSQADMPGGEKKERYIISSLIEEAITSSQLEGATTTRLVAKEMLRTGRPPVDVSEQMILNNYLTMTLIRQYKDTPMTPELVFEIHKTVTEKTLRDPTAAGRLRRIDEDVKVIRRMDDEVLHDPPLAHLLPSRLEALCRFANEDGLNGESKIHPLLQAIIIHFWIGYDHPFCDGNGRTARALFYWKMLKEGYWLFEFVSISRILLRQPVKYGTAYLHCETDPNDLTYFIHYHLGVVDEALDTLAEYLNRKAKELKVLESLLRDASTMNHRQKALMMHVLKNPAQEYTFESHRRSHNVTMLTARKDLNSLQELGYLTSRKAGRKRVFRAVKDLEEKLLKRRWDASLL